MAKRNPNYRYKDIVTKRGTIETLTVVLYAPDGSIFNMPHGGDPAKYVKKGFLTDPNPEWEVKREDYLLNAAASLKRSDFRRTIKERETRARQLEENAEIENKMAELDAQIAKREAEAEAALNAARAKTDDQLDVPKAKKTATTKKKTVA